MSEETKKQILAAVAANPEVKSAVENVLSLSAAEIEELKQIMSAESDDEPVMESADERNNPGPGVVG